jgi:hypothetical protein
LFKVLLNNKQRYSLWRRWSGFRVRWRGGDEMEMGMLERTGLENHVFSSTEQPPTLSTPTIDTEDGSESERPRTGVNLDGGPLYTACGHVGN